MLHNHIWVLIMKIHYCFALLFAGLSAALLEESIIEFEPTPGAIDLTDATILRDINDPVGVRIATDDLASDLEEVTGIKRRVLTWDAAKGVQTNGTPIASNSSFVIIAATADSALVAQLEDDGKISVDDIRGKWETFALHLSTTLFQGSSTASSLWEATSGEPCLEYTPSPSKLESHRESSSTPSHTHPDN
jgi:hypothetical protein